MRKKRTCFPFLSKKAYFIGFNSSHQSTTILPYRAASINYPARSRQCQASVGSHLRCLERELRRNLCLV
ncbi:hypothetical protein, partial [Brevibacillus agri]|uniref:hypothetical protein n=1 Tax=Brevibacillus agri TaxID=51101 RepID=UPI002867CF15